MTDKNRDYFSTREASDLLGVAVSTIQLWTKNGILRAWTTGGGHRRIARNSVEEMLRQQRAVFDSQESILESVNVATPSSEYLLSVVIVEDDEQQLRLFRKQFSAWKLNASIFTARNGYEGLIKIGQALPDVIITDLNMPKMNGLEMVRAIKELPELEHSLIIVITGLKEDEIDKMGGLPDGAHLLSKPVLIDKLKTLLRQKALEK